jgi:hypothetical protein
LSGSTSTTTSPTSFFSDRRLKEDIKQVGKAHNGLPIYTFKYKGDPNEHTHVGFMADEVEKIHPEAVGMSHGFKTVDYKRAAKYSGGVVAEGGAVMPQHMGQGFADGGMTVAEALNNMNSMQANMPVSGGGVNNGVAASAAALNPAPVVPAAALEAPKNYFLNSPDLANSQAGAGKGASSSTWNKNQENNSKNSFLGGNNNGNGGNGGNGNINSAINSASYSPDSGYGGGIGGVLGSVFGGGDSGVGGDTSNGTDGGYASGGRAGYAYGSTVTTEGSNISPNDLSAIIAEQQQMYGPYSQEGMTTYGMKKGAQPGGKSSYVPQAMASAAHLMTPKDISPRGQTNTLSEITGDLGDIEKLNQYRKNLSGSGSDQTGGLLYKKPVGPGDAAHAGATLDSTTPDNLSDTFKNALSGFFGAKNGGVIDHRHGYATKGAVQMYGVDNLMSDVDSGVDQTPEQLIAEQKGMTPGSSGSGSSGASGLSTALTLGKTILGFLPFAEGGVVPREHHADGDVVGDPSDQVAMSDVGPFKMREDPKMTAGVDPRLLDIIRHESVSLPAGQSYDVTSGVRENTPANPNSLHRLGKAVDVGIMNEDGTMVPNYQDPASFKAYEDPAKVGREFQQKKYPELNKDFNWGGYFSGPPGKYGAMDLMHQSIGEHPAGGSWEAGLKPEQAQLFAGYVPPKGGVVPPADIPARGAVTAQETNAQPPQQGGGLTDTLTSEKFLVPLLSGLGKMAGSNSRYLGSAILQGIGGAAESYENVLQNQQQRALTGGQADVARTVAASNAQGVAQGDLHLDPMTKTLIVDMPNGRTMTRQEWIAAGRPPTRSQTAAGVLQTGMAGGTLTAAGQPATPDIANAPVTGSEAPITVQQQAGQTQAGQPQAGQPEQAAMPWSINNAGKSQLQKDADYFEKTPENVRTAALGASQATENRIAAQAAQAQSMGTTLNTLTSHIMSQPDTGPVAAGVTNEVRSHALNVYNDMVTLFNRPDLVVQGDPLANQQVINKIHMGLGFLATSGADQNSQQALQVALAGQPGSQMSKQAALDVISSMYVAKQRALDQQKYLQEWKSQSPDFYLAQNAEQAFRNDHGDNYYNQEKHAIRNLFGPVDANGAPIKDQNGVPLPSQKALSKDGKPVSLFDLATNPSLSRYGDKTTKMIEKMMKSPYLTRYFSNQ